MSVRKKAKLRPAFSSKTVALYFLALMISVLLLPKIISEYGLVSRMDSYDIMPKEFGEYSYIKNEIFNEEEDIDILFVGTSILWNAIDTPQVQNKLNKKLGRQTRVRTFGFNFTATDPIYAILRDLLEKKRVRMVVLSIPREKIADDMSLPGCRFIRYNEFPEMSEKISLKSKISQYSCSILRSPHDLLTVVRANKSKPSPFAKQLGAKKEFLGMNRSARKFEKFAPPPPVLTKENLIYSKMNRDNFQFLNEETGGLQSQYLEALIELLSEKKVSFLMLNIPQYKERQSEQVIENLNWSERFGKEIPLIGTPPKKLFAGLNELEIEKLYCDEDHFNVNGNEFFTRAVLPGILEVYEQKAIKDF